MYLGGLFKISIYSKLGGCLYVKINPYNNTAGKNKVHIFNLGTIYYTTLKKNQFFFLSKALLKGIYKNILIHSITYFKPINHELYIRGYGLEFFIFKNSWLVLRLHRKSKKGLIFLRIPKNIKIQFLESTDIFRRSKIRLCSTDVYTLGWFANYIKSFKSPETYTGKGIFFLNEIFVKKIGKIASFL